MNEHSLRDIIRQELKRDREERIASCLRWIIGAGVVVSVGFVDRCLASLAF